MNEKKVKKTPAKPAKQTEKKRTTWHGKKSLRHKAQGYNRKTERIISIRLILFLFASCILLLAVNGLVLYQLLAPRGTPVKHITPPHAVQKPSARHNEQPTDRRDSKEITPQDIPNVHRQEHELDSSPADSEEVDRTKRDLESSAVQADSGTPKAGTLVFIFDDAGHNLQQLDTFLQLPFPCTIAVLPQLRYSQEAARRIRQAGKEVILHQPMQAVNTALDPGPGALLPGLTAEEIKTVIRNNLTELHPVAGMNNHEGSLITADRQAMQAVLETVAEENIFFLDSRTTPHSVAAEIARERQQKIWERDVFLDNDRSRSAMEKQIGKGLAIARKKGFAILIGHVFTAELAQILTELYPTLIHDGFSFSTITEMMQKGYEE